MVSKTNFEEGYGGHWRDIFDYIIENNDIKQEDVTKFAKKYALL
ncbi:hypothetical protein ALNOE001_09880 [Candidatus Methanobinarius endosymbioticus]|uniref:Uncharacterized protein n=1 Tax=Candidatus Methanobinarius endosymbioticus TaxID=2006182 RepID=A0A366MBI2_9EURY|nr:hypothetical protein ALNOE001_09880 [Candidatus Methanobinarius endosymbioticus]